MAVDNGVVVAHHAHPTVQGWRQVFAVQRPRAVALTVVAVATAVFTYEFVLITVFDARSWWGHTLPPTAASFAVVFIVIALFGWHRAINRRRFAAFVVTSWAAITMVSWLPRQRPPQWPELAQLAWWACWCVTIYVLVPVVFARLTRQSIRGFGLRMGLFRGEMWIFAILLPAIVAGAYLAAGQPRFQEVYPFYHDWTAGKGTVIGLVAWWGMYGASFVALEFFYRGFMVTVGFAALRWWAIPAMAAPYCLLHLDKPLPELVTSLFGGLLLGVVALRTGSILAGVLAHVTLAVGTDAAVLARRSG